MTAGSAIGTEPATETRTFAAGQRCPCSEWERTVKVTHFRVLAPAHVWECIAATMQGRKHKCGNRCSVFESKMFQCVWLVISCAAVRLCGFLQSAEPVKSTSVFSHQRVKRWLPQLKRKELTPTLSNVLVRNHTRLELQVPWRYINQILFKTIMAPILTSY